MDLYIWNLSTLNSFPGLFLVSACHLGEDLQSDLYTQVVSVSFVLTWDAKLSIDWGQTENPGLEFSLFFDSHETLSV